MSSVILIAEDEASIADAIEIYLKSQGYQTLKAANGAIAWELLQNNTVDLAIIDVMMPVMDGIALTMKIRELYEFPIIILSAKSEDIDKITGLNIGADDYVTKPFVPMELLARVHAQLRRHFGSCSCLWSILVRSFPVMIFMSMYGTKPQSTPKPLWSIFEI